MLNNYFFLGCSRCPNHHQCLNLLGFLSFIFNLMHHVPPRYEPCNSSFSSSLVIFGWEHLGHHDADPRLWGHLMAAADPLKPLVPSNLISCYGLEKPSSQPQMFQRKKQDDYVFKKLQHFLWSKYLKWSIRVFWPLLALDGGTFCIDGGNFSCAAESLSNLPKNSMDMPT